MDWTRRDKKCLAKSASNLTNSITLVDIDNPPPPEETGTVNGWCSTIGLSLSYFSLPSFLLSPFVGKRPPRNHRNRIIAFSNEEARTAAHKIGTNTVEIRYL